MLKWSLIVLLILLIFGARRIPELGRALGRAVKNFKRASSGLDEIEVRRRDRGPDPSPREGDPWESPTGGDPWESPTTLGSTRRGTGGDPPER